MQALALKEASNRSVDIVSRKEGEGVVTKDFAKLFSDTKGSCDYSITNAVPAM